MVTGFLITVEQNNGTHFLASDNRVVEMLKVLNMYQAIQKLNFKKIFFLWFACKYLVLKFENPSTECNFVTRTFTSREKDRSRLTAVSTPCNDVRLVRAEHLDVVVQLHVQSAVSLVKGDKTVDSELGTEFKHCSQCMWLRERERANEWVSLLIRFGVEWIDYNIIQNTVII